VADLSKFIAADESLETVLRRHPARLIKRFLAFLVVAFGMASLGWFYSPTASEDAVDVAAGLVTLVFVIRLASAWMSWSQGLVGITDRRVIALTGALRRRVTSVPLTRIHEIVLSRGFWGRILRYGDVTFEMGDRGSVTLTRVPRARSFVRELTRSMASPPPTLEAPAAEDADTGPLPRVVI